VADWRDYLEPGDDESTGLSRVPEPERDVPPALGVIFGCQVGWSPERESRAPGRCPECGNAIRPGSRLVCAGCLRSGMDDRIRALLAVTPPKPRIRPHRAPTPPRSRKCPTS
jgi:hypothetical protein